MKKYALFAVFILALVSAGAIGGYVSRANAGGPPKVYGLYDANNTYLGDVIGAFADDENTNAVTYTTYMPSVEGILQFRSDTSYKMVLNGKPVYTYYTSTNCIGTGYVGAQGGSNYTSPWILEVQGATFKLANTPSSVAPHSVYTPLYSPAVCQEYPNPSNQSISLFALSPITLPFNKDGIASPFTLK